jgi:transcriptional regulator with XRE-family HTH domain
VSFGRRLKFLRRRDGLPVGKVAEKVGLPKELLRDMEAGRRAPTRDVIHLLATHFDVKPVYFEAEEPRHPPQPLPTAQHPQTTTSDRSRSRRRRLRRDLSARDFSFFQDGAREAAHAPSDAINESGPFRPAKGMASPTDRAAPRLAQAHSPAAPRNAATAPTTAQKRPLPPAHAQDTLTRLLRDADPRSLLRALIEAMVRNGLCSADDIADALERYE